jgi:hypothetical protein
VSRNLILQHFEPVPGRTSVAPWLVQRSSRNIRRYAERLGAEYRMLSGEPFRAGLRVQCQKVCILNEEFDDYDVVVVMDTDKFVTTTCRENVFEARGIGFFSEIHRNRILPAFHRQFPRWSSRASPFWSGSIYVMPRAFRQLLRAQIDAEMEEMFRKVSPLSFVDEGIVHCLCVKARVPPTSLDLKWDYSSYLPHPQRANIIHVRHKPKSRDENFRDLVAAGIIEEE